MGGLGKLSGNDAWSRRLRRQRGNQSMRAFGSLGIGVALACVVSACTTDAYRPLPELRVAATTEDAVVVTMYNLVVTPERFDGKVVHVIGVGRFETGFGAEDVWALYPTRDDLNHMTCAMVYIENLVPELQPETQKLAVLMDKYVWVTGTFRAAPPLPLGVISMRSCPNAGELHAVTQIKRWEYGD